MTLKLMIRDLGGWESNQFIRKTDEVGQCSCFSSFGAADLSVVQKEVLRWNVVCSGICFLALPPLEQIGLDSCVL